MEVIVRLTKQNPWTGLLKWNNCFDYVSSYWTRSGARYTGLTPEKARELEEKLRYPAGTLDPNSSFWDTYAIKIGKKDVIINTDTPEGELQYLFLKNNNSDEPPPISIIKPSVKLYVNLEPLKSYKASSTPDNTTMSKFNSSLIRCFALPLRRFWGNTEARRHRDFYDFRFMISDL